jgi:hypothetical protein
LTPAEQRSVARTVRFLSREADKLRAEADALVAAAPALGLVGSSGQSTGTHFHFDVPYRGQVIDPFTNPTLYWRTPLPYAGTTSGILGHGITDHAPTDAEFAARPAPRDVFTPAQAGAGVYFWFRLHGMAASDVL